MFKVNNKDSKTAKRHHCVVLMSLLLTLNIFHTLSSVSIVNFEQVNAGWDMLSLSNGCLFFSISEFYSEKLLNT